VHRTAAIFELARAFDHILLPQIFHNDISYGSGVTVLIHTHRPTYPQTNTAENNPPRYTIALLRGW